VICNLYGCGRQLDNVSVIYTRVGELAWPSYADCVPGVFDSHVGDVFGWEQELGTEASHIHAALFSLGRRV
jgi:hypothetical protein